MARFQSAKSERLLGTNKYMDQNTMDGSGEALKCRYQCASERNSEEALNVIEVNFRNDRRWMDFIISHPDALIYHHPGWLSALESEYGRKCTTLACEAPDGAFRAILPLLPTRGLPFRIGRHVISRRLSSLPRTPLAGPVADNAHAMKAILERAIMLVQAEPNVQLEIKSTLPGLDQLVPGLTCAHWRGTYTRALPNTETNKAQNLNQKTRQPRPCSNCDDCRQLRFGSARANHQVRWAAKKALKEGVSLCADKQAKELRNWYRLYLEVMRRNVVPPRPFRFFQALYSELSPLGHLALVLAELDHHPDGSAPSSVDSQKRDTHDAVNRSGLISGSILLQFGQTAIWAFTGSNDLCLRLHANDLTLWNCMHDSCMHGFNWFDLGEVAENHPELIQFKAKWGAVLQPTYRYYYPISSSPSAPDVQPAAAMMTRIAAFAWQRLPLSMVELFGDWAYRFL